MSHPSPCCVSQIAQPVGLRRKPALISSALSELDELTGYVGRHRKKMMTEEGEPFLLMIQEWPMIELSTGVWSLCQSDFSRSHFLSSRPPPYPDRGLSRPTFVFFPSNSSLHDTTHPVFILMENLRNLMVPNSPLRRLPGDCVESLQGEGDCCLNPGASLLLPMALCI